MDATVDVIRTNFSLRLHIEHNEGVVSEKVTDTVTARTYPIVVIHTLYQLKARQGRLEGLPAAYVLVGLIQGSHANSNRYPCN